MEINPQPNDPVVLSRMLGVLRQLEQTAELKKKEEILSAAVAFVPNFRSMLLYTLDPYRKYGIQQWKPVQGVKKTLVCWDDVHQFLDRCRFVFAGDRRIEACQDMQSHMTTNDQELLRRIVLKDLRCGVGATLVNKVFPGLIPEFGVMLASPVEEKDIQKWSRNFTTLYGQAKENGDRLIVMVTRDFRVESYSRNGHRCHNYSQIESSLSVICQQSQIFRSYKEGAVFDGEVINGDFWGTRGVKKLKGNDAKNAIFHCFDLVCLEDWRKNTSALFAVRNRDLARMSNEPMWKHYDNVEKVVTFKIPTQDCLRPMDILHELDAYRDHLIGEGKEGLIIRLDLPYNYKTRSSLFKHKKRITGDFLVVRVEQGEAGKKYAKTAGKIVVDLGDGVECKAGLKCDELSRALLWDRRAEVVGQMAEVEYSEMTQNKEGISKLWHPVFIRVRKDKS